VIEARELEWNDVAIVVSVPMGADWLAVADLEGTERTFALILRCVKRKNTGEPLWQSVQDLERVPVALLLNLDRILGELMEYDIADPTSARCADCPAPLA